MSNGPERLARRNGEPALACLLLFSSSTFVRAEQPALPFLVPMCCGDAWALLLVLLTAPGKRLNLPSFGTGSSSSS